MRQVFARHRVAVATFLVAATMLSSLGLYLVMSSHAAGSVSAPSVAFDNLPSPSTIPLGTGTWWPSNTPVGTCPTDKVSNSVVRYSWRGVLACGPINNNVDVAFPPNGAVSEGEWQCPELVMRYMYLAYGIPAYVANGNAVVDNYAANNINPVLQAVANDGKSHTAPVPGDILSYYDSSSAGHTALVIGSTVNTSGFGTLTTMEQNFAATSFDPTEGVATLDVGVFKPWVVTDKRYPVNKGSGIKNWLHHVLDVSPQSGLPSTLTTFSGSGFAPNETVTLNFDNTVAGLATADKTGNFSATVIVPASAAPGRHTLGATGKKGFAPNTVFYVSAQPTPTPTATATPTPTATATPTPPVSVSVTVPSTVRWVDTGLSVTTGETLIISAAGSWSADPIDGTTGPDGYAKAQPDNFLNLADLGVCAGCATTATAHWGALVGYIGSAPPAAGSYTSAAILPEAQKVFLVGSTYNAVPPLTGELWLNFNDDAYSANVGDNAGQVTVTISVVALA